MYVQMYVEGMCIYNNYKCVAFGIVAAFINTHCVVAIENQTTTTSQIL